jgi:solute carrier family 12 (potassium/chloride transporters), member 8
VPSRIIPNSSTNNSLNSSAHPDSVTFRGGNIMSDQSSIVTADDEPIVPTVQAPIHSKTKNWYSGFCNRWASLLGVSEKWIWERKVQFLSFFHFQAITKIMVMLLVNWLYAIFCIITVFVIWFYVGTANPAVKPGLTHEFRFFVWLKNVVFRCFG